VSLGAFPLQAAWAIGVLVLGAIVVLLSVGVTSTRPALVAVLGVPFAVVAGVLGLQAPLPLALAIVGLCGVATLALLLLPGLEAEVSAHVAEAGALLLLGTSGAIALAAATDLLQAVVGLETLALSAVILVALSAGPRPLEAALKYFVLGALSLAGLLYGLGLVYLANGSFAFPTAQQVTSNPLVLAGVVLIAMGFAFELAVFPFHWGALDAYSAATPSVAGYVMSASKLAAAFALGRVVVSAGLPIAQVLVWVGALTIVWGTFGALAQANDLRRMLGYSAITHAGFIALAVGSGPEGPTTAFFYAAVYGSMAMLVFAALAGRFAPAVDPSTAADASQGADSSRAAPAMDLRSFGRLRAAALALGLLSLGGVPPTPGFWAKLAVLVVAWQSAGLVPTLIAVAGGVFSVLYYLRPLPALFAAMRGTSEAPARRIELAPGVLLATAAVVVLGLFPGLVWSLTGGA
jgi:NADH-quinone oxidoreductase subunit N